LYPIRSRGTHLVNFVIAVANQLLYIASIKSLLIKGCTPPKNGDDGTDHQKKYREEMIWAEP
jgi:hypothetical protein